MEWVNKVEKVECQIIIIKQRGISLEMKGEDSPSPSAKYSTKGRTLVAKGKNIIQLLNKSQKLSPSKKTKAFQHSPVRSKQFVANMPQTEGFLLNNKIILTEERVRQINRKLEIDKSTSINLEQRVKNENLYINTTRNPISHDFTHEAPSSQRTNGSPQRTVLTELHRLRDNQPEKARIKTRLAYLPSNANNIYLKMQKENRNLKFQSRQVAPSPTGESRSASPILREQPKEDDFWWLDKLVNTKEESYFDFLNKGPKNIFALLRDRDHSDFLSNCQILKKVHMDTDSMMAIPKNEGKRLTINPILQVSSFSREMMCNQRAAPSQAITLPEISVDVERLQFQDLTVIACGRLNTFNFHLYLNENMENRNDQDEDQIALSQIKKIVTEVKTGVDRATNCLPSTQNKAEITYFLNSHLTEGEKWQVELSTGFKLKLKKLLEDEIFSISNGVMDRQIMHQLRSTMDQALFDLLEYDADRSLASIKGADKRIRYNKVNKSRAVNIKINEVIDALRMKKQFQNLHSKVSTRHTTSNQV